MGFYISDFETELKQHLNLSDAAWLIIEEDIHTFSNGAKYNKAGFLNRIISNYYEQAEATISLRKKEKNDYLVSMFSFDDLKNIDSTVKKIIIEKLLNVYVDSLKYKIKGHKKGRGEKFRINKENVEMLRESAEADNYNNSIGLYLKAILEEYAQKSMFEREQIYFKDILDILTSAIVKTKKIKMSVIKTLNADNNELYARKFYFSPYKIIQDKLRAFNYVIGYSEEINDDGTICPKRAVCYRISRIEHAMLMSSMSGFISKSDKEKIEREIMLKNIQFLAGEIIDIKVRFTDKGKENFNRQIYMRPELYDIIDDYNYIFHCTEVQAMNYFFKFARDVEIIEPESLRYKFIERYNDALKQYGINNYEK